ncbi:MAG: hypothetical protein WCG23_12630 [bacterium]
MVLFIRRTITTTGQPVQFGRPQEFCQPFQFGRPQQFCQPFQFGGNPFNRNHGGFLGGFRNEGHRFEHEGDRFRHEGFRHEGYMFRHDNDERRFGYVGNNYSGLREFGRFDDDRFNDRYDDDSFTTGERMSDFADGLEDTVSSALLI